MAFFLIIVLINKIIVANHMLKSLVSAGEKYDLIMLDVDSKDPTVGMSSPPKVFIQPDFLKKVEQCLTPNGETLLELCGQRFQLNGRALAL